jgi:PBP1b-binding outer membrane lipoprotein LpoB
MKSVVSIAILFAAFLVVGCSSSEPSNMVKDADQAAIDAYDAQIAENDKAVGDYSEKDLDKNAPK